MDGISLAWRLLPQALLERHALQGRIVQRTEQADREIRFLYREWPSLLPVWYGGELRVFAWGRPSRNSPLPKSPIIAHETLASGTWRELEPEPVEIPATFGYDKGIWYRITQGVQGVLVHDHDGTPVVYVVTRDATHYYQVMTRNSRQPLLIGETI